MSNNKYGTLTLERRKIKSEKGKKHSSKIVEKLGTYAELQEKLNGEDPIVWAKAYIQKLNFLEKRLANCFTCQEIVKGLRDMNFLQIKGEGYAPTYTRTDFTDALHKTFGFYTDTQIVDLSQMKKILRVTKK